MIPGSLPCSQRRMCCVEKPSVCLEVDRKQLEVGFTPSVKAASCALSERVRGGRRGHRPRLCHVSAFLNPGISAPLVAQQVKDLPARQEAPVPFLGLGGRIGTHSSILAWRIPWTEEPGRLQFMGSQRVGYDGATFTSHLHFQLDSQIETSYFLFISNKGRRT